MVSLVFFLATVLLFQTVTFSPIALAQSYSEDTNIPSWFKTNAKWWKEGKISDRDIINAIENLWKRGIIKLDSTKIKNGTTLPETRLFLPPNKDGASIPSYVKNTFASWEEGVFSDSDVANTIKFLVEANIITSSSSDKQPRLSATIIDQLHDIMNKDDARIPSYVKNILEFWEEGSVSDSDVTSAVKFLIETNIINSTSSPDKQPRQLAAIIDQLHDSIPNESSQQKALEYLESAGYDVDVYTTEDITVDFYKKLPSMNYKFIYIRTHSFEIARLEDNTYLFTGEKYDVNKHIEEQLFGQVAKGLPLNIQAFADIQESDELVEDNTYFVIGSKFVDELMVGKFPQTVIIIGGCESIRKHDLAKSLIFRGASAVVGWDRTISSLENDLVMLKLLEEVLINKTGFYDAIPSVMQEFGSDLQYSAMLQHIQPER